MAGMIRKQLYLTVELDAELRRAASRERRTEAEILRDALARHLHRDDASSRHAADESDSLWRIVGIADHEDDSDLSDRVDDVVYGNA